MSTTTLDVQQARDRVVQLARQIEELSRGTSPPDVFFEEFLQLLVQALGAHGAAAWMIGSGNRLELRAEANMAATGVLDDPQAARRNEKLLSDVAAHGQACSFGPDDGRGVELPSQHLLLLSGLQVGTECAGVVEVFHRADAPAGSRAGYLQFVEQMCGHASRYLERQRNPVAARPVGEALDDFADFILQLQRSLDVREVSAVAANDGRLFLDCDRLSVVMKRGRKAVVQAISGQDSVHKRANLVRAMAALSDRVMAGGEAVVYSGTVEGLPPQVEQALADYLQESGSRMVAVVPLFESEPLVRKDEDLQERRRSRTARVFGCLVAEQSAESRPRPGLQDRIDLIADHVASSLFNARSQQRVFLLPVWRALGSTREWFYGRKLFKTLAVLALVAVVIGSMAFVPWDYRVEGEGRLMPVVQNEVFAPLDGDVRELFVRGGDRVARGQPLLRLQNDDLRRQLVDSQNRLREKEQLAASLAAQYDEAVRSASLQERIELQGRLAETRIEIAGLREDVKILEERHALLTVHSPIDGVVATFQVEQLLEGRPVRRGEVLLEVMDDSGAWRLELEVKEHRLGHILRAGAAEGLPPADVEEVAPGEQPVPPLSVEFILATALETTLSGELAAMATRSDTSAERGSIVEVYVMIDADQIPELNRRIGAEVRAKINCGKRSLGYVLFGDVVEFVQKYFWL